MIKQFSLFLKKKKKNFFIGYFFFLSEATDSLRQNEI